MPRFTARLIVVGQRLKNADATASLTMLPGGSFPSSDTTSVAARLPVASVGIGSSTSFAVRSRYNI